MLRRKVSRPNAIAYAELVKALLEGGYTMRELADQCGLHYVTVTAVIRAMHARSVVHISGWEPDRRGNLSVRVYSLGKGSDAAKKLKAKTDVQRAFRERKRRARLQQTMHAMFGPQ